ncbi:LexA/Signal peptidase [Sphaerulina musiva SO2202]|uniref:Mitochondrial inner membrane protease subunit n=1 Tax=Sphaerulina musiva (strain SO2202) TaxID=692275 RepID=M3B144_SPHMS|nr:LexA/Signal peptidase [Sphaerulina musiva SO2202]EMF13482.1 LexA/Signal peptidase [Sphaerulina musiva SO2202]
MPPVTRNGQHGRPRHRILSSVSQLTHRGQFGSPAQWVAYALAAFFGLHVFYSYFHSFDLCHGISMMPTIFSFGEWVWISKYYRRGRDVEVGDLVSFKSPIRDGEHAIKRVIGLPGDFVLMNTPGKSDAMIQIPEGHCWVVGDNLAFSRDSRVFGPLPMGLIIGKVLFKFNFHRYIPWDFESLQQGLQSFDESDVD